MAKKAPQKKGGIEKKKIDTSSLMAGLNMSQTTVKEKEISWIPFNDAFHDAVGIPGIPKGETTIVRGFSDTGKSTAIYEAIAGAQKTGIYPVIFDTEGSFKWDHARDVGMVFDEIEDEDGNVTYKGDFLFFNGDDLLDTLGTFDYASGKEGKTPLRSEPVIEDIAKLINDISAKQKNGEFTQDILFVWDSIGSIDCFKSATKGASNNQWNAGALNAAFKSILHYKIPSTKRETSPYTNTFLVVNKIWLDNSGMGQPIIKHSGGEGFKFGARLIVHMGGKTTSSAAKISATSKGAEFQFATVTKIEVVKNHVTNVTLKGKIASTAHGYWNPDTVKTDYKSKHKDYIMDKLGTDKDDFNIEYEEGIDDNQSQS